MPRGIIVPGIFSSLIEMQRIRIEIYGAVQGVGFRPFVYNLATALGLKGWVNNTSKGVFIEAEGEKEVLDRFIYKIKQEKPPLTVIHSFTFVFLDCVGFDKFEIRQSDASLEKTALVLPDIATCPECIKEIFDPKNRRYLYPFTNCTHCGPRYSIIEGLPYDRSRTSMKAFEMCDDCKKEYKDPKDRRFHAQPNACPKCGPHVELWDKDGKLLLSERDAVSKTVEFIKEGKIIALKGLGGFHLIVDAKNDDAVLRLRQRKHREEKPFALMFPTIESIEDVCDVSEKERFLLCSNEAPIVLLRKKSIKNGLISQHIAPDNPYLGAMLPYTPLHHILLKEIGSPVVATSGNFSDDTICIDENDAFRRLKDIADVFLVHNRPIVHHVDDSISRIINERPAVLRRARGYSPLPVRIKDSIPSVLGVGGHLKNTIALSVNKNVFISQHIGDLESEQTFATFKRTIKDLEMLHEIKPISTACDFHPDYLSTKYAKDRGERTVYVQHHHAHIVSCMAENHLEGKVLGVSWDGTGYGEDESIWGGEFLLSSLSDFKRIGHFKTFFLPGGDTAAREPRRTALGLLYEVFGDEITCREDMAFLKAFRDEELPIVLDMLKKNINCHATSSVGRLFDAVSSIIGLKHFVRFEGQAAMALEYAIDGSDTDKVYKYNINESAHNFLVDWQNIILGILDDLHSSENAGTIAAKFHNTLAEIIVDISKVVGERRVVLSGGCFQNKYLTEKVLKRLNEEGFVPYWHQNVPPNDGGISLGQAVVGGYRLNKEKGKKVKGDKKTCDK